MKRNMNNYPPLFVSNIFIKSIIKNNNGVIKIKKIKNDEEIDNNNDNNDNDDNDKS